MCAMGGDDGIKGIKAIYGLNHLLSAQQHWLKVCPLDNPLKKISICSTGRTVEVSFFIRFLIERVLSGAQ